MKDKLDVQAIINDYKNGMGAEKIALKYHVGKIKNILVENGITLSSILTYGRKNIRYELN